MKENVQLRLQMTNKTESSLKDEISNLNKKVSELVQQQQANDDIIKLLEDN
jgi:hypothetical protein